MCDRTKSVCSVKTYCLLCQCKDSQLIGYSGDLIFCCLVRRAREFVLETNEVTCISFYESRDHVISLQRMMKM